MNLNGSEDGYKETTEIKDYKSPYQQRDRRDRQTYREFIFLEDNAASDDYNVWHKVLINVLEFTEVSTKSSNNQNLHPNTTE